MHANLLIVSDLHFGEDLLPGASVEKQRAVALGASAFCELLRYHGQRRLDGRPWRLVVAGDLFDFMAVRVRATPSRAGGADQRRYGPKRSVALGAARMAQIGAAHQPVLAAMMRFAAAGHEIDVLVGNHDIELLEEATVAELRAQLLAAAGGGAQAAAALERIRVQPWFLHLPGVAWIEHGHVYDEACSFEHGQAPFDPLTGQLVANVDDCAVRYLAQAAPELDPHGTEEWGFSGYLRYAIGRGAGACVRLLASYAHFTRALWQARAQHRSAKRRRLRQEQHRQRVAAIAAAQGLTLKTVWAVDRLSRAPVTKSARRLMSMLMLDRWATMFGGGLAGALCLLVLPGALSVVLATAAVALGVVLAHRSAISMVGSQVPMAAVPRRLRRLVDAPVVVFGHTHDPSVVELAEGGVYFNTGTWLPASRPGILRSFTHVIVRGQAGAPQAELRQWRDGKSVPFREPSLSPSPAKGSSPRLLAPVLAPVLTSVLAHREEPPEIAAAAIGHKEASGYDGVT